MPIYCPVDGSPGVFVKHEPKPPLPRGVKWRPPDLERDRCTRTECGRHAVDHWTLAPERRPAEGSDGASAGRVRPPLGDPASQARDDSTMDHWTVKP